MDEHNAFELSTRVLGALPILQHVFDRLQLDRLLSQYVPVRDRRTRVPPAAMLGVALRNIVLGRRPLYGLQEWAAPYAPELLGLQDEWMPLINDDRAGRALDQLFDADRASLMTAVVVRAIEEFDIDVEQFHNDSSTITFSGEYAAATGRKLRGKRAARITHGHNKDHRPDLKQLLWILTTSADGFVPVHFRVCDGNTNDDPTHIASWEAIRRLVGRPDFLYVADSKLCSRAAMGHIAAQGGRFVTVVPRSRKEDAWFRRWIQDHQPAWEEVIRRPNPRDRAGPPDVWRVVEAPNRSGEGYRVVWVHSLLMAERQQRRRLAALQKGLDGIERLNGRLQGNRVRIRERSAVDEAVDAVLKKTGAKRWADVEVVERTESRHRQERPGRPSANTRYVRTTRIRFELEWKPKADVIAYDAKSDGMYPLMTNCEDLALADVLAEHKSQPRLEKRHEQLETVLAVAPVMLKNEGRIEALLLLYFIALLVQSLIERDVRLVMAAEGIDVLPLYPEERECRAPTANRILEIFDTVQTHALVRDGTVQQRFRPTLSSLQDELLRLIGAPRDLYETGS